jgi:hypothetical protein
MNRAWWLSCLFFAAAGASAKDVHLAFDWPSPDAATRCELASPPQTPSKSAQRFAGTFEQQDMGPACTVQVARKRFDALYRLCAIDYTDSPPREHYACWVMYSPQFVTFLYSYSPEWRDVPPCAFVCSVK